MNLFISICTFLTFCFSAQAEDIQIRKKALLEQAQRLISQSTEIQKLKSEYGFALKHPEFIMHEQIRTVRFQQQYVEFLKNPTGRREWRVFGGDVQVHYYPASQKLVLDPKIYAYNFNIDSNNLYSEDLVKQNISNWLKLPYSIDSKLIEIKHRLLPSHEKIIPTYFIDIKGSEYSEGRFLIVNAQDGSLISLKRKKLSADHVKDLPPILVYDGRFHINKTAKKYSTDKQIEILTKKTTSVCQLISTHEDKAGEPLVINIQRCEIGKDDSAKRATQNTNDILSYYLKEHNHYGFDNDPTKKTPIVSLVHAGEKLDNAYWDVDRQIMIYGDGSGGDDKDSTNDYTLALDLSGHEFTHAIINHTANFSESSEADPGAMDEAFADIFGVLISRYKNKFSTWAIGAKIYHNLDGDSDEIAMRSLSKPEKFLTWTTINGKYQQVPFPSDYTKRLAKGENCDEDNDFCESHANSTIWSHAAYLISQNFQDKLNISSAEADKKMARLYFITLSHKLRSNETMLTAAQALLNTCQEVETLNICDLVSSSLKQSNLID